MKFLIVLLLSTYAYQAMAACNRPVDPKKIVLMMSFHDGSEEERGAIEGACARGEKLVVLPKPSPEAVRVRAQIAALERRMENDPENADLQNSMQQYNELNKRMRELAPDYDAELAAFLQTSAASGAKVTSLIVSGHDGGGHYYGDYGETDMAELSNLAKEHPALFSDTSSLLLMGCWSGTPDQVEQWKVVFPKMRVLGGFVGSAPASTRRAAGTYISGLLRGEKNLPRGSGRANVQAMLNAVNNLNMITAGVYINPSCEETGRSPAYYYVSPAQEDNELSEDIHPGLNTYAGADAQKTACLRTFGGEELPGSYDWNAVLQYYQGVKEPGNNPELRSLYSFLRNNEHCFINHYSQAKITPDQVLFLRFFQDMKKNFNTFFQSDLENMYKTLDKLVAESTNPELKTTYENHKKLKGDSLISMTRKETLEQISVLQGVYDLAYRNRQISTPEDLALRQTMGHIDMQLYRLKCVPPTWHEYVEGQTPDTPSCNY
jgi:hypothetical protein